MKKKLKTLTHQVDLLKEEMTDKEAAHAKAHLEHQRTENEKESLKVRAFTCTPSYKGWFPCCYHVPGLW